MTFITFEGISGAGVSTQAQLLRDYFQSINFSALLTRELGGSPGAEQVRSLLLEQSGRWSPPAELLLYAAARRDHSERTIWPALKNGDIVICDHFADRDRALFSLGESDLRRAVDLLHSTFIHHEPEITFLIDVLPETAQKQMEEAGQVPSSTAWVSSLLETDLRVAYLELAKEFPERIKVIDGNQLVYVIHQAVLGHLHKAKMLPALQD